VPNPFLVKIGRFARRQADATVGRLTGRLERSLSAMTLRPFELHLELTNLCNANCIFCPYQFQTRAHEFMPDEIFERAVDDYCSLHGGSVGLTPIVGDPLIDPKFLDRVRTLKSRPEIDRIFLTTNAILLDRHGVEGVIESGIDTINISTSGFDEPSYRRIYRSSAYSRMLRNVRALVEENTRRGRPLNLTIALRTDRPLREVMKDSDFQPILEHEPQIDFTWAFASAGGRIRREALSPAFKLKAPPVKRDCCVNLFNGPIVLPDGTVIACACIAALDAPEDLVIGDITKASLGEIWQSDKLRDLRASFPDALPPTCASCDMYHDLTLYRSSEGSRRAQLNRARLEGATRDGSPARGPFAGG
jgi:MoaA/NifB/PqqE/SkfB family radical SAM enzyme